MTNSGVAIAVGWAVDRVLGEPPSPVHPVAAFGRLMGMVERHWYRPTRLAGARHAAVGIAVGAGAGVVMERMLGRRIAVAVAVAVSVAGKMLADEANAVLTMIEANDITAARGRVRSLVGRTPDDLGADEIVRAVIESLAENTVDAVIAPLCWAAVAGAPGVLAHRAINTLDAMVGHRSERYERFGWASARIDDIVNYVPARFAVLAIVVLAPNRVRAVWRAVRHDAVAHPSPNGGVIEAATAAALGVQLGGTNRYGARIESRGVLGDGPTPSVRDARRAVRLTTAVGAIAAMVIACTGVLASNVRSPLLR
jgi:adenosylcobinamide-phosphate synthase